MRDELSKALNDVMKALEDAEEEYPIWPQDMIHCGSIVSEEAGELLQACNDYVYGKPSVERLREEAAQVAAMGLRFLMNLENDKAAREAALPEQKTAN